MKFAVTAMVAAVVVVASSCANTDAVMSPDRATSMTRVNAPTFALTQDPIEASVAGPETLSCATGGRFVVHVETTSNGMHDIIALMDGSNSLGSASFATSKAVLTSLVNNMPWGPSTNRLGIIRYETAITTISALNQPMSDADSVGANRTLLNARINGMNYPRGSSHLKAAVQAAITMFDVQGRAGARKTLVFFTDGVPNPISQENPCGLAGELIERDIDVKIILNGPGSTTSLIRCLVEDLTADIIPVTDVDWDKVITGGNLKSVVWRSTYHPGLTYVSHSTDRGSVTVNQIARTIQWDAGDFVGDTKDSLVLMLAKGSATGLITVFSKDTLWYRFATTQGTRQTLSMADVRTTIGPCDATPPVVTADILGTEGVNPWFVSDVHVSWSVTDAESAVTIDPSCEAVDITVDTPGTELSCSGTSAGGTTSNSVTIKRDAAKPVISFSGNLPTYRDSESIEIMCTASDATSGINDDATSCATYSAAPRTLSPGRHEVVATATDNAGNTVADTVRFDVIPTDETAPMIVASVNGVLGSNGWYTSEVSIAWLVTDAESAVSASTGCDALTLAMDTNDRTITCSATSAGGTGSESTTVKIDRTAPVISFTGNAVTYSADVTVNITCNASDAMSGVATSTCATVSAPAYSFGAGTHTLNAAVTDRAGNSATSATTFTVTVDAASLSAVIDQIIGDSNVANGLRAKLDAIARGNGKNRANLVKAFVNQVEAQRGKKLSNADADLLIALSASL